MLVARHALLRSYQKARILPGISLVSLVRTDYAAQENRRWEGEARMLAITEEERRHVEEAVNVILALEESERLERLESLQLGLITGPATFSGEIEQLERSRESKANDPLGRLVVEADDERMHLESGFIAEGARLAEEAEWIRSQEVEAGLKLVRLAAKADEWIKGSEAEAARTAPEEGQSKRRPYTPAAAGVAKTAAEAEQRTSRQETEAER
ncbi:hypothetical protein LTR10_011022 [Elasticomyces elasticus]|nr:hypothetical protein LTR10_011022 [Elasticomyces elasticus]KAK4968626.1 hypothetical protein LTR42_009909 [Elasticomyces elasticus]